MNLQSLLFPLLLFAAALATVSALAQGPQEECPTLTIEAGQPVGQVSPMLYGLMTEELNHAYDGGLYAELVRNRAFLDDAQTPVYWSPAVPGSGSGADAAATIALDKATSKGVIHAKTASRTISRLSAQVHRLAK